MKTSKGAMFKTLLKEVRQFFLFPEDLLILNENKKSNKRRSDRILTILVAVQPGGAHHQGPRQAHKDPGAGDQHFYNKCSRFMVLEDLRY
jgi:hypothetical protein